MQYQYPLDLTGTASSNFIEGEPQVITEINGSFSQIIIPDFAPFYLDNLKLTHLAQDITQTPLVKDVDYFVAYPYQDMARESGKLAFGAIVVIRRGLAGRFKLDYQTVGDKWVADTNIVKHNLLEKLYNPRMVYWDQITNVQDKFPPVDHSHEITEMDKWPALLEALNGIIRALGNRNFAESSIYPTVVTYLDTYLPSLLSKEAVGLGDIVNLPLATAEDIATPNAVKKYFTLDQGLELIKNAFKDPMDVRFNELILILSTLERSIADNTQADENYRREYTIIVNAIKEDIISVKSSIDELKSKMDGLQNSFEVFDNSVTSIISANTEKVLQLGIEVERLKDTTATTLGEMHDTIEGLSQQIQNVTVNIKNDILSTVNHSLEELRLALTNEFNTAINALRVELVNKFETALAVLQEDVASRSQSHELALDAVKASIRDLDTSIRQELNNLSSSISNNAAAAQLANDELEARLGQAISEIRQEIGTDIAARIKELELTLAEAERNRNTNLPSPFLYYISQA